MGHDVPKSETTGKRLDGREADTTAERPDAPRPGEVGQADLTGILLHPAKRPAVEIEVREWSLVLTAKNIPHVLRRQGSGWRLYVPYAQEVPALAEIRAYTEERAARPLPDPGAEPARPGVWLEVLAVVGLLTAVFGLLLGGVRPFGLAIPWRAIGAGDTATMLAGQWWRAVTALCLHADPGHLLGNAACGALFLGLLGRETGVGLAFALCLVAGGCGNVAKALIQGPGIHFLGASTAVFGALGALGATRLVCHRPRIPVGRAVTAGAVLMLLAMLGAGSEDGTAVDLAGHFLGFTAGGVLGLMAGSILDKRGRPGPAVQTALGLVSLIVLATAWGLAIGSWSGR